MPPFANLIPAKLGLKASLLPLRIRNLFARRRIAKSGEAAEFFPAPFGHEVAKAGFVIGKVLKWARGCPLLTHENKRRERHQTKQRRGCAKRAGETI